LVAEAFVFTASRRRDVNASKIWRDRLAHPEWLDFLMRARVDISADFISGAYGEALRKCDAAIDVIHQASTGPFTRQLEDEWTKWRSHIAQIAAPQPLSEPVCETSGVA